MTAPPCNESVSFQLINAQKVSRQYKAISKVAQTHTLRVLIVPSGIRVAYSKLTFFWSAKRVVTLGACTTQALVVVTPTLSVAMA